MASTEREGRQLDRLGGPALFLLGSSLCVCACVCKEYYDYRIYYLYSFSAYIFVDLVKRGVLTLVGEIRRYRNDCYY